MPYKDPHSPKAIASNRRSALKYAEKNREKLREKNRLYYEENQEKEKQRAKDYAKKNPEIIKKHNNTPQRKEWKKEYNKREDVKYKNKICSWERVGIISDNWEEVYILYCSIDYCMNCNVDIEGWNKHLDHNHDTGEIRGILCKNCNVQDKFKGY